MEARPDGNASRKAAGPVALLRGQLLPGPTQEVEAIAAPPLTWRARQELLQQQEQRQNLQQMQQQPDCGGADALLAAAAAMEEQPPRGPRPALPLARQESQWEAVQRWDAAAASAMPAVPLASRLHASASLYPYHLPGTMAPAGGLAVGGHAYLSPPPPYSPVYFCGGLGAYLYTDALHPLMASVAPQPQYRPASWGLPPGGWEAGVLGLPPAPGALQGWGLGGEPWLG